MSYTKSFRLPKRLKDEVKAHGVHNISKYFTDVMRLYAGNPDATLNMLIRRGQKRMHDPVFANLDGPLTYISVTTDPRLVRHFAETAALFERSVDLLMLSALEDELYVKGVKPNE